MEEKKTSERINKLKKLNIYESYWSDYNKIIHQIMEENINIIDFRNNLNNLTASIIKETVNYEMFFIKMLACLDTPHRFISHSLNTGIFAYILSSYLNVDKKMIPKIIQAALLHDIGKLNYNESIKGLYLYRNEDPSQVIKYHSIWGNRILQYHLKSDPEIARMVLNHHERIDGSGFPRGLKGSDLTIYDNIVMTANLIDNIIQKTNYSCFDDTAKNIDMLLTKYSEKFILPIRNVLYEIFTLRNEERKHKRYKIYAKGLLENDSLTTPVPLEIFNISTSGMEVSTPVSLNNSMIYTLNSKISQNLSLRNKECEIIWKKTERDKFIYGMKFNSPQDYDFSKLLTEE